MRERERGGATWLNGISIAELMYRDIELKRSKNCQAKRYLMVFSFMKMCLRVSLSGGFRIFIFELLMG